MDVLDAQPIINEPALFIQDQKMLVVADLHIGIESELIESGINAEPQTNKMIDHLVYALQYAVLTTKSKYKRNYPNQK